MKLLFLPLLLLLLLAGCSSEQEKREGTFLAVQTAAGTIDVVCGEDACPVDNIREEVMLEPVPANTPCTRIYGGPEKVSISGVSRGEKFSASFNKLGGCEIERWNSLVRFLKKVNISEKDISAGSFR